MDAGEFWTYGEPEGDDRPSLGEVFTIGTRGWRYLLRWLLRSRRS